MGSVYFNLFLKFNGFIIDIVMIKLILNIVFFLAIFLLVSCNDPSPIEISNNNEEVEIEIINPEPNSYVITGYDSTGITDQIPERASVISVSGVKNTIGSNTILSGNSEAIFFDLNQPVKNNSDKIIGYKTIDFESVEFDDKLSEKVPYRLFYRDNFQIRDTLLGTKHRYSFKKSFNRNNSEFIYNKSMKVKLIGLDGKTSLMTVRIPDEVFARVIIEGTVKENNLTITLFWERSIINQNQVSGDFSEEVIVGGLTKMHDELVPLFKLKRFSKNNFIVPNSLVEDILNSNEYKFIVFTFIRKIRKTNSTSSLGDVYFASQSIHNIWVKI